MKKITALVVCFILLSITPLYAASSDNYSIETGSEIYMLNIMGETSMYHHSIDWNKNVNLHEMNSYDLVSTTQNEANIIKLNGIKSATKEEGKIEKNTDIKPMGRSYIAEEDSFYDASEFTKYLGATYEDIHFENRIITMTKAAIVAVLLMALKVEKLASIVAGAVIALIDATTQDSTAFYYIERKWNHKHLGSLAQRIKKDFYFFEDYTTFIESVVEHSIFV